MAGLLSGGYLWMLEMGDSDADGVVGGKVLDGGLFRVMLGVS